MSLSQHKPTDQTILKDIQSQMPPLRRLGSKILHYGAIDYPLEILRRTLFRPYAAIGAAIGTSATLSLSYFIAFYAGYTLAGTESLIGLAGGWFIGLCIDLTQRTKRTSL